MLPTASSSHCTIVSGKTTPNPTTTPPNRNKTASRRQFLRVGGLAGIGLPQLLYMQSALAAEGARQDVNCIFVFILGGMPHQDMWDLKPDAPSNIRGEFSPIKTNVPGIEICELFPRLAKISDKLVYIRSIVGATGSHRAFQCLTGRDHRRKEFGQVRLIAPHRICTGADRRDERAVAVNPSHRETGPGQ